MNFQKDAEDLVIVMEEISKRIGISLIWHNHTNDLESRKFRKSELDAKVTVPLNGLIKLCDDKSLKFSPKFKEFIPQVVALKDAVQAEALEIMNEVHNSGKDVKDLKESFYDIVTKRFSDQYYAAFVIKVPGRWLPDMYK